MRKKRVRIDVRGQQLCIDRAELLPEISGHVVRPHHRSDGCVELRREPISLQASSANIGLLDVYEEVFDAAGNVWDQTAYDKSIVPLSTITGADARIPPGLSTFLQSHACGLIRRAPCVNVAMLVFAFSILFRSVGVVASKKEQLNEFRKQWCNRVGPGLENVTLLTADEAHPANYDVLIILDARDLLHQRIQKAMPQPGGSGRLYGLIRSNARYSPSQRQAMAVGFGPASVLEFVTPYAQAARVQTASISISPTQLPRGLSGIDLFVQGYWLNPQRNRRIARLASALARGDAEGFQRRADINAYWQEQGRRALATVVRAANPRHALDLMQHMPEAHLDSAASDEEIEMLGKHARRLIGRPRASLATRLVVTDGTHSWSPEYTDCVIWAAGGPWIDDRPQFRSYTEERRSVLLVDCYDRHHKRLRAWSDERKRLCMARGWFPVGTSESERRVWQFLDDQLATEAAARKQRSR